TARTRSSAPGTKPVKGGNGNRSPSRRCAASAAAERRRGSKDFAPRRQERKEDNFALLASWREILVLDYFSGPSRLQHFIERRGQVGQDQFAAAIAQTPIQGEQLAGGRAAHRPHVQQVQVEVGSATFAHQLVQVVDRGFA